MLMLLENMVIATQLEKVSMGKCHWIQAILVLSPHPAVFYQWLQSATVENLYKFAITPIIWNNISQCSHLNLN